MRGRGAFQEMDYRAFFGSTAKWATEVDDPARLPEIVQRAFHIAMQGRPGPVVVALPEDVLTEAATSPTRRASSRRRSGRARRRWPNCRRCCGRPSGRSSIVGGGGWSERAGAAADALRRALRPAGRGLVPPRQPRRQRPSQLRRRDRHRPQPEAEGAHRGGRSRAADRRPHVGNAVAGLYAASPSPSRARRWSTSTPTRRRSAASITRASAIVATPPAFCAALEGLQPPDAISWSEATRAARAEYLAWSDVAPANPGRVQLGEIMLALREAAPDAIFANGAGNFAIWPGRFLRFRRFDQQLGPTSGSMGFGVPAAVAAKRAVSRAHGRSPSPATATS